MSIESDLSAFRELALEEQIKIPYYMQTAGDFSRVYHNLDPVLDEIVGNHQVTIAGEVYLPDVNEQKQADGIIILDSDETHTGQNLGVWVSSRNWMISGTDDRLTIGYRVAANSITRLGPLEETHSSFFAFAPIESSRLYIPELIVPEQEILPEGNDRVAMHIDNVLLNDPKDFAKLIAIFDSIQDRTELEIGYYINYLNTILPLRTYSVDMTTSRAVAIEAADYYRDLLEPNTVMTSQLEPSSFDYLPEIGGLCMIIHAQSEDNYTQVIAFPLRDISKLRFTASQLVY